MGMMEKFYDLDKFFFFYYSWRLYYGSVCQLG